MPPSNVLNLVPFHFPSFFRYQIVYPRQFHWVLSILFLSLVNHLSVRYYCHQVEVNLTDVVSKKLNQKLKFALQTFLFTVFSFFLIFLLVNSFLNNRFSSLDPLVPSWTRSQINGPILETIKFVQPSINRYITYEMINIVIFGCLFSFVLKYCWPKNDQKTLFTNQKKFKLEKKIDFRKPTDLENEL